MEGTTLVMMAKLLLNVYYWNKVTVHHLKLCYFLMKKDNDDKDNDDACVVVVDACNVVVVKLASTPMMDTHDTEFVN